MGAPGFYCVTCWGVFLFRYGFLSSVPKESPVQITAVFAKPNGDETYVFTDMQIIDGIMDQLRTARLHRKLVCTRYLGDFFIFKEIRFQYKNQTYIYDRASGNQFYLYAQDCRWKGTLYAIDSEGYGAVTSYLRQACEIPSVSLV